MNTKPLIHELALGGAKASLLWLIVLLALEAALPGFVSRFFNLVWIILLAFVMALLAFVTHAPSEAGSDQKREATFIQVVGMIAATYAWLAVPASLPWRLLAAAAVVALGILLPKAFTRT